jgi:hypothetical protein
MTGLRGMLTGLVLGSALFSRQAVAQHGSSVSLTHMVTVTVPPRVKVQVRNAVPAVQSVVAGSSVQATTNGLAVSIRATQSWTLSIASAARKSPLKWSHDQTSGFSKMGGRDAVVASGTNSQVPTDATIYFRNAAANEASDRAGTEGLDAVTLTVVAQ